MNVRGSYRLLTVVAIGCCQADARTGSSRRGDTQLAPVWEWGHTELSFDPDLGGFRRVTSTKQSASDRRLG